MRILPFILLTRLVACQPDSKDDSASQSDTDTVDADSGEEPDGEISIANGLPCTQSVWTIDADGDGYGDPASVRITRCFPPSDQTSDRLDCDDSDASRYPGAPELCGDGVVNDCNADDDAEAVAFCSGSGPFGLERADAKLVGVSSEDYAGYGAVGAEDLNGDGWDDLLISAGRGDTIRINVVLSPTMGTVSLSDAEAQIYTEGPTDGFTTGLAGAGDVDGDGLSDIVAGAPGADRAYLVLSPVSGGLSASEADTVFLGDEKAFLGRAVVGLGDADGDGASDLLLGDPEAQGLAVESDVGDCPGEDEEGRAPGEEAGIAYLFNSPPSGNVDVSDADARLIGEDTDDVAGTALARPGDLDGDGLADIYLSAPAQCEGGSKTGAAYVVLSPVSGDLYLGDADGKIYGSYYNVSLGASLSGAGDTNGDGTPDLLVGDPDYDLGGSDRVAGMVYLFLGPVSGSVAVATADATFVGEGYESAGSSIASAGDLDADGFDDLVIGAWSAGDDHALHGAAYILHGPFAGAMELVDADATFVGGDGDYAGCSVAGVGDTDADGMPDILIGAYGDDDGGEDAGAAYLLLGGGALLSGEI